MRKSTIVVGCLGAVVLTIGLAAMLLVAAVLFMHRAEYLTWRDGQVKRSQQTGDAIVRALDEYRDRHGRYPEELAELTPQFIEAIEPPVAGTHVWDYETFDDGGRFVLRFEIDGGYPCCWYDSEIRRWYVDR